MRCVALFTLLAAPALAQVAPPPAPPPKQLATDELPPAPAPSGDAAAQFAEAEAVLDRFAALRFEIDPKADLTAWSRAYHEFIQTQAELMVDLQTRYTRIASTAAPQYAVPALVRVGEVTERFADGLRDLRLPDDAMPAETQKSVRRSMQQAADGIRRASRGHYEQAIQRAQAGGVTGEWVEFAKKRAAALAEPKALAK